MKAILVSMTVLVFLSTMLLWAVPEPKVTICHFPPGNPENVQVITIGQRALPVHETHCALLSGEVICDLELDPSNGCELKPSTGLN